MALIACTVNCVCPGVIATRMVHGQGDYLKPAIAIAPMNRSVAANPSHVRNADKDHRVGTSDEVADCVLFLSSSKATFVQGSAMVVDGGYTIN